MRYALVGNPNCGKTTIFNVLTGLNQKVGNWSGVTVDKKVGYLKLTINKLRLLIFLAYTVYPHQIIAL